MDASWLAETCISRYHGYIPFKFWRKQLKSGLKMLLIPIILMVALVVLIYTALTKISFQLEDLRAKHLNKLTVTAQTELDSILELEFNKFDSLIDSGATKTLLSEGNSQQIGLFLKQWQKSFHFSLFAFFDPATNTFSLSNEQKKTGQLFGLKDWIAQRMNAEKPQLPQLNTFKSQSVYLNSSLISVSEKSKALFITGFLLNQQFVEKISQITSMDATLRSSSGLTFSTKDFTEISNSEHAIQLKLPEPLSAAGYTLTTYYQPFVPFADTTQWPPIGTGIASLIMLLIITWLMMQRRKQELMWKAITSAADAPKQLRALRTTGIATNVATVFAEKAEHTQSRINSTLDELKQKQHKLQTVTKQLKAIKAEHTKLLQAPKLKSGFLSRMGDEVTVPMKSVSSMLKLLSEFSLDDEPKEILGIARRSQQQLSSNINNILDFSKLDAGLLKLFPAEFDLEVLIQELVTELKPHAESKALKLEWSLNDRVPLSCFGDRQRICQILFNLAANAIRFTKDGTVGIYVDTLYVKGTQLIRFSVTDTGIGLPKEAINSIFESLEQHSKLTNSSFAGRIKLIVSKQLAELMGGNIGVSSEIGKGSRFWFTIRYQAPK